MNYIYLIPFFINVITLCCLLFYYMRLKRASKKHHHEKSDKPQKYFQFREELIELKKQDEPPHIPSNNTQKILIKAHDRCGKGVNKGKIIHVDAYYKDTYKKRIITVKKGLPLWVRKEILQDMKHLHLNRWMLSKMVDVHYSKFNNILRGGRSSKENIDKMRECFNILKNKRKEAEVPVN